MPIATCIVRAQEDLATAVRIVESHLLLLIAIRWSNHLLMNYRQLIFRRILLKVCRHSHKTQMIIEHYEYICDNVGMFYIRS